MSPTTKRRASPSLKVLRQQQEAAAAVKSEDTGLELMELPDDFGSPEPEKPAPPEAASEALKVKPAPEAGEVKKWLVLGLDPSLTDFGWSLVRYTSDGSDPQLVASGRWKTAANMPEPVRYLYQRERLNALLREHPDIAWVGTETPAFGRSYSEGMYALYVQVQQAVWHHRKRFVLLGIATLKSMGSLHLPGYTGVMDKPEMIKAATRILGASCPSKLNHNIADSVVAGWTTWRFARLAEGDLSPETVTTKERASLVGTQSKSSKGILTREGERWFDLPSPRYDAYYNPPATGHSSRKEPGLVQPVTYR
jgi:hypothetical protein